METQRLILRKFYENDFDDLYEYLSDSETVRYEPYEPMTRAEVSDGLNWRISTDEMTAVVLKDNGKMIGNIYLGRRDYDALELGYVFNRKYWKNGYAKESCLALVEDAFMKGVHRIYAECDPENQASWHLLESIGFKREAYLRKNVYFHKDETGLPIWKDTYIYARLNDRT